MGEKIGPTINEIRTMVKKSNGWTRRKVCGKGAEENLERNMMIYISGTYPTQKKNLHHNVKRYRIKKKRMTNMLMEEFLYLEIWNVQFNENLRT